MPKMKRPDGRTVSVSEQGVEPLKARGYTLLQPNDSTRPAATAPAPAEEQTLPERPAASAPKGDWVEYAEAQGVEVTDKTTKSELVERFTEGG